MAQPHVLILRAPGTNCDQETAFAFETAGAKVSSTHVNGLLKRPQQIAEYQILCIPGGFSYGDDIAAGRILGLQMRKHLAEVLGQFRSDDKLILGICNGFQVLCNSGILLDEDRERGPAATLTANQSGKFECRWVQLGVTGTQCVFLHGLEQMYLPVAHAEGRFVARDPATFDALEAAGQLVLRYRSQSDFTATDVPYPDNPNGAEGHVAGVCDATGRVFGLMPHPERHIDPTHHPRWTRGPAKKQGDGLAVFQNAVRYFA